MKRKRIASVILAAVGIAGGALSVCMLIPAIQLSEWGRVIAYCVTLAVCVELAVLNMLKLNPEKKEE